MTDQVTLRKQRDGDGSRRLTARLSPAGDLVIEGQDIGPGVERAFGPGIVEYEWAHTIVAAHLPELRAHLGGPVLDKLATDYAGEAAADIGAMLEASGVPVEFWSRRGD